MPTQPLIVVSCEGPKPPLTPERVEVFGGGGNLQTVKEVTPDTGLPPLFYCKPVNDKEGPCHASDCDHCSRFVLQLKREQHTKNGKTVNHQDDFRCTISCGFCGKHPHYEDECHIKMRESDKLKRQGAERKRKQTPYKTPRNEDK